VSRPCLKTISDDGYSDMFGRRHLHWFHSVGDKLDFFAHRARHVYCIFTFDEYFGGKHVEIESGIESKPEHSRNQNRVKIAVESRNRSRGENGTEVESES
jgi:hypothetical protein